MKVQQVRWRFHLVFALTVLLGVSALVMGYAPALATNGFSPNQELPLPFLAPVPTFLSPLAFVVRGLEPSVRTDAQGTIYVSSIRGVPGGVDLHRWYPPVDGGPNSDGTLPFKYEGQPDNCGILTNGCANNVNNMLNPGLAPGGGDVDIAVNAADPVTNVPNLPLVSLSLAPGVTATHSVNRGDSFTAPNVAAAVIPIDDRQWVDAIGSQTVYLVYHDVGTFNIEVQRSNDGGLTYLNGFGEAIDQQTFLAAGNVTPTATANIAGQIKVDRSSCPSRGNLYQIFVAPDNATENALGQPMRSVYVGVSKDAKRGLRAFTFTDHKLFASPAGSLGATNGTDNIFPALAVDDSGFVYAVWSDNSNIFFSSSSDQGAMWTSPIQVNQGATIGNANVFPWVAADAGGHAVVVWFGDDRPGNSNDRSVLEPGHPAQQGAACSDGTNTCMTGWANWNVYVAETIDGHDPAPAFTQFTASDHVIHRGTVSTGGLGGGADRSLADLFQVSLDPQHRADMAFSDDHKVHPLCSELGSGQCGPDDPQTTRLIRANFTYELQPNPAIITTGTCAGTEPEEAEDEGQGEDANGDQFAFMDHQNPDDGTLVYDDPSQGLSVRSSGGVQAISYNGSCVSFTGNAKVNGQPAYQFAFTACDWSALGTGIGSFSISLTGPLGFSYQRSSTISTGFVKLQVQ
jgi:hypothetical protein